MTTEGFFELYAAARPALFGGEYVLSSSEQLIAGTPHDGDVTIPVDDTAFHLTITAPRYAMPPDQILSTFPPNNAQGDWRERMPQIVLKRRTLPWERDPTAVPGQVAPSTPPPPPWLALVVLADGEGHLSEDVDVSQCVTPGVDFGDDADVPKGRYLQVTKDIVEKVFPCLDELDLLCHVRKVDLSDTELAMGDDDGYLAVVLSSRLPQPAPPAPGTTDPLPLKYTAYLINLEHQTDKLLPTEPTFHLTFDRTAVTALVDPAILQPAPRGTLDQLAMRLGAAANVEFAAEGLTLEPTALATYDTAIGAERAASAWQTGPALAPTASSDDVRVAGNYKMGFGTVAIPALIETYRFPVLVSWDFTCTGDGGFERLMTKLDVGLFGTLAAEPNPPIPEVAPTGHVALEHLSRRGELTQSWFRGPFTAQPTKRVEAIDGVLPLANVADQLRKVVPDGREDISLAALFEIGRLLTLNKPTVVAALMQWRKDLFGAGTAWELADQLAAVTPDAGLAAAGGRDALENLIRTHVVGAFTAVPPEQFAPRAPEVTAARLPDILAQATAPQVLTGLGADPQLVLQLGKQFGVDGLAAVPPHIAPTPEFPVSQDQAAMAGLGQRLGERVDELVINALKFESPPVGAPAAGETAARPRRSRRKDTLDRLIEGATRPPRPRGGD